jgi:hypothetical protein
VTTGSTTTTMWEARAADGRLDDLVAYVLARVASSADLYRSDTPDPRLVVIDPTGRAGDDLSAVPEELLARPAHAWDFEPVPRNGSGG